MIAGDGYLCKNESIVSFGMGAAPKAKRITIDWPSGYQQQFTDITADQRLIVIEDQRSPFIPLRVQWSWLIERGYLILPWVETL